MSSNKRTAAAPTANGPSKGPAAPTPGNTKTYADELNRIGELINKLSKDTTGRQGYEQLQQQLRDKSKEAEETKKQAEVARESHESRIHELQAELDGQKKLNQNLHDLQRDRAVAWNADTIRLELESAELTRVKQELERVQDELENIAEDRKGMHHERSQLRRELRDGHTKLEDLGRDNDLMKLELSKKELELQKKENELQKSRKTLKKLNDDLGLLPLDPGEMEHCFKELASKFHKLVWNTFSNGQGSPGSTPLVTVSGTVLPRIPQVTSNSQAARYMRCALAEAAIAEVLSTDVFQDTYLGGGPGSQDLAPLVTAMRRLQDGQYGMQATIIRCQLVKVCQESDTARRVASQSSQKISHMFHPWLEDNKSRDFAHELNSLFFEAVELWQKVQRTRTHAKVVMSLEEDLWNYEDDSYQEYNKTQQPDQDPRSSMTLEFPGTGPVAVLFPQIQADKDLTNQPGDDLIYPGHALFPTQPAFIAARAERSAQPTTPTLRRSSTIDRRRGSRTERQEGQTEAKRPSSRRLSTSSRDGTQQRPVLAMLSDSERGSVLSSAMGRADPTASVSSTRSRRSGGGARGGG